jgi:hypothetical protein
MNVRDLAVCIGAAGAGLLAQSGAMAGWPFPCGDDGCAPAACVPGCDACAPCGPAHASPPYTLFSLFGIECDEDDDDDEDSKLKKVSRCFCPAEPPRAESAFALPARFTNEFAPEDESAEEDEESAEESGVEDRCEVLEKDLTRLTLIVEELAKGQARSNQDLTRLSIQVDEMVGAQRQVQDDLTRINVLLQQMAENPQNN